MGKRIIKKTSVTRDQKLNDVLSNTEEVNGCLIWTRCVNTDGYPAMSGNVKVHRFVYKLAYGENIDGKVVRHKCDNPLCINPDHLISGTNLDNVNDMVERYRHHRVITKEVIQKAKALLSSKAFLHTEIAQILGIDARRVSDINRGKYADDGRFRRK